MKTIALRQGKFLGIEKKGSVRVLVEVVMNISHLLKHPTICIVLNMIGFFRITLSGLGHIVHADL